MRWNKFLPSSTSTNDDGNYIELGQENLADEGEAADYTVRISRLRGQKDVMAIKDAVYDGDLVLATFSSRETGSDTLEEFKRQLKEATDEVGGDIVQTDGAFVITPSGVRISRERLE